MTDGGFNTQQVKDVVSFAKGKPPAEQPYFGKDAEIYLTPEYLRGGAASEPIKANKNAARVSGGETIVLWDGSNAGEVFRARDGVLSSTMVHLKPADSFDCDYFFYAMKGWEGYLKGQTSGSGIPHVDKEVLGKLELVQFPTVEQTKIAEILSTVDQAIEQTEALFAKQQRIKTGLMQDLLTRGIDEHGQLRTEQTHAFKDSPLGRIPVEWEVARLGEVTDISAGVTLGKSHEGPDTVELPYLRVANVQDGYLDLSELKSIRVPNNHIEKYALKVGDVLMNEGGDFDKLGRGAVWRGQVPICLHQNHVFKVRPHNEKLASDFLAAVSASPYGKSFFMMASKQSTNLASINSTQLKAFPIPLPDYQEQIRIQTQFNRLAKVLDGSAAELKKQRSLKTALMQDLLTGRKRVTDLLEPAAA
jgi:type I restriction enzyme S subunit